MSAIFSPCGLYRYRLERHNIGGAGAIAWLMVNPSTADATHDDHTIKKVIGFSQRAGAGWLIVGNKFAYRSTDIKGLRDLSRGDAVGIDNNDHLRGIMRAAPTVVVAWGPLAKLPEHLRKRWVTVSMMAAEAGVDLQCLGTAKDGQPLHPLMVAYDTPLRPWVAPK